jgi:hypothetical protein
MDSKEFIDVKKENDELIESLQKNETCRNVINYPEEKEVSYIPENPDMSDDLKPVVGTYVTDVESGLSNLVDTQEMDGNFDLDQIMKDSIDNIDLDNLEDVEPEELEEEDIKEFMSESGTSMLGEMMSETEISPDSIKELLQIVNRKIKGETFNIYAALPRDIKSLIDRYVATNDFGKNDINSIKKTVAAALIEEFTSNIQMNKAKNDFAKDMEAIYQASSKEISDAAMEYIEERNKAYREAAEKIEDPDKKAKLLAILDQIDEARSLDKLKEFAKTCKLKRIEIEKPEARAYNNFIAKYKDSNNNIYDIKLAQKVLMRIMGRDYGLSAVSVIAFLVAFCKQVNTYSSSVPTDHAYMYYVLYYCALLDSDKSDMFKNNVKEVIENLKTRNSFII